MTSRTLHVYIIFNSFVDHSKLKFKVLKRYVFVSYWIIELLQTSMYWSTWPIHSPPVVIIIFANVSVRTSVPTFQNKQNKRSLKLMIATGWNVGLAEGIIDDTCLVYFVVFKFFSVHSTILPTHISKMQDLKSLLPVFHEMRWAREKNSKISACQKALAKFSFNDKRFCKTTFKHSLPCVRTSFFPHLFPSSSYCYWSTWPTHNQK